MDITTINYSLEKIQLLFVEDDQIDRLAFTRTVKQHSLPYEYTLASSLSEAVEILRDRKFQIAILDYNLGDGRSSDLFPILKEQNCPFVISTGSGDEETAARLMSQGAADYLIKDPERNYLKILPVTIGKTLSRHQAEGQLHLLNRAITSVKDGIYILNTQGKIQYINNTLAEFSHISPKEAIGQSIQVLNQPNLSTWLGSIRSCADENCSTESEIVMCRADGTNFVALVSETCVIEDLHLHRVGVIHDVTSLKTVEQELRISQENLENTVKERTAELQQAIADLQQENQERLKIEESLRASRDQLQQQQDFFKLVIDSNPNLIFVKDWDGRYLLANQPMAEFYNTTVENLVGKTDADFHPNTVDAERFLQENRQIIEAQQEMFLPEERITHAELGYQWLQWQKRPIKIFGNIDGVLGVGVNITTRKQIEISLSESQQRFESLAVVAPVGIFRTDTNGNAIYLNDRWCQIAGLTEAEADGANWARALHPDDREMVATKWYASVQENRPFQLECRFQNKEGATAWVLCQSAAERNIDGEIIGYVGTITDISDRKRAETILQKLVTGTAAVTGADFFVELVRHIADALDVTYALVTEFVDQRLVSLAFWANDSLQPSMSYLPAKTPCEICMQEGQYHCEESVQAVFAEDPDLVTMRAESYLGIALKGDRGQVIGNLCVLDTKPMAETKKTEAIAILQVFAARASAELQRKNVNEALNRLNQELEIRVHQRTQELQERERFLQTVLDSFPLAVFWKDRQSVLLGCNQLFATTSGVESPLDVVGKTNFDFSYTEEEALKYLEDDQAVMESGLSKIGIEETITLANGQVSWVETNKIPLRNTLGEVVGIVGTFQDITDRKVAEATLAESEAFNRQLVTEFPIGLASCHMDGQLVFVNAAFAKILGRTVEETLALTYWDITPIKYAEQEAEQLRSLQTKGRYGPYEKEYIHKDGHLIPVLLTGVILRQNGEGLIWSSVQDISDRKQAEQQVLESQRFIEKIAEASPNILYLYDQQEHCNVYTNREIASVLGYTPTEIQEMGSALFANLMHPDDLVKIPDYYQQMEAAQDGKIFEIEYRMRHANGEWRWLHSRDTIFSRDDRGQIKLTVGTAEDISDRKQVEAKLRQSNEELVRATRLKDEFLANMSHELRTPLNSILGMNETLQEGIFGSINERQLKALQTIESSSTHLLSLINDILDVSKIEAGQVILDLTTTNIENLCKSSLSFVKQQALTKRIQLIHKIPKYLPKIMVDERRIRQVLINLLNNAVKFTLEGGAITLEVTQVQSDASIQSDASATNLTPLNYLRIAVIDTGIGISAENIQKLFQPFIQIDSALNRQYTGTGLGLVLVKKIAELHGGSVELTSELGVGSCFSINLPFNVGDSSLEVHTDDVAGQSLLDQSQTSSLILLAEDNEASISTFSSYLTAKGYRLVFAKDGQQAIAIAKAEHPDLILMDIQMPGMDGLEAIKQIRLDPDLANIPIIALTALAMTGDREKFLNAGANEYLPKPVKLKQLAVTIQQFLILENNNV